MAKFAQVIETSYFNPEDYSRHKINSIGLERVKTTISFNFDHMYTGFSSKDGHLLIFHFTEKQFQFLCRYSKLLNLGIYDSEKRTISILLDHSYVHIL